MISADDHQTDRDELLLDETLELDLLRAARSISEGGEWPVDEHDAAEIEAGIKDLQADGFVSAVYKAGKLMIVGITPSGRRLLDDLENDAD